MLNSAHISLRPIARIPMFAPMMAPGGASGSKRLSNCTLAQYLTEQFDRISVQCFANRDKFGHVHLPLLAFYHANDGMRPLETRREIPL
jgi:hypothetical protein